MLAEDLPDDLPVIFISAVSGKNMQQLKDMLWNELNSESNKLQSVAEGGSIVHRDRDVSTLGKDFADWTPDYDNEECDEDYDELEEYDLNELEDVDAANPEEAGIPEELEEYDIEDLEEYNLEDLEESDGAKER